MKRRTNRRTHRRVTRFRRSTRRRGGGVGAPPKAGNLLQAGPLKPNNTGNWFKMNTRDRSPLNYKHGKVDTFYKSADRYTLHINHFAAEHDYNIKQLNKFFTTHCWKDKRDPAEAQFGDLGAVRYLDGHFIYIRNPLHQIVFATLALMKKKDGETLIELMGTCTAMEERGKGLFKRSLPTIINHYKGIKIGPYGHPELQKNIYGMILTADYKNRDGVTPQGRHIVFSKSGFRMRNNIDSNPYYVKTEDESIYKVVPTSEHGNLAPEALEVVVEEADGTRKKIPVATVTGCYKDAEATEREECPFILPFVYDH